MSPTPILRSPLRERIKKYKERNEMCSMPCRSTQHTLLQKSDISFYYTSTTTTPFVFINTAAHTYYLRAPSVYSQSVSKR